MLVRVLGDVALVTREGTAVPLRGIRQPALLAALTARAGQVVSIERLVDLVWDDLRPDNPEATVHSTVFKLRASLARAGGREVLVTRDRGYLLDLKPGELDAEVFSALVRQARDEPPGTAANTLMGALRLWRGTPYAGFADSDLARIEALRLEEMQRVAIERCGAALVQSGRTDEAVALLQPFVAEHPLREAARITLMHALHGQGRTADALDQFQDHRRALADELGIEPSRALLAAQVAVLQAPTAEPSRGTGDGRRTERSGLTGMRVRYLRTDAGQVIAYGTAGAGPPVVVLLGWVSSLDVIASGRDPRSSLLDRLTDDLTLTLYDRAGTGLSPGPVVDYGLDANVDELADVVRAVGHPVSLLAMSSAGPIALRLSHQHPDWVRTLVLWGTFADGPATFPDNTLREQIVDITRSHWGIGSKILADLYRPGIGDEAAWHLAQVFRDSASADVAARYLEHLFRQDVTALLASIEIPTLVLHYSADRLIRFRGGQHLASGLPNATFMPLDGRVHLPDAADLDTIERAIVGHVLRHAG
jgi:DNA-binding SARP family transcriptional activator/pimeloyl-ACP methyl ester carboxylesterase